MNNTRSTQHYREESQRIIRTYYAGESAVEPCRDDFFIVNNPTLPRAQIAASQIIMRKYQRGDTATEPGKRIRYSASMIIECERGHSEFFNRRY